MILGIRVRVGVIANATISAMRSITLTDQSSDSLQVMKIF
jgi:hypothetical protein